MVIVNKLAEMNGLLNEDDYKLTQNLAKELLGKSVISEISLNGLDTLLRRDKKTEGNLVNFVIITKLGNTKFLKLTIDSELIKTIEQIIREEF